MFNLLNELKKYKPYNEREKEDVNKTIDFLENNENCFSRSNLKGHVTSGAYVCDGKGEILLNHHKEADMWFQFGGHSDGEENSFNVAKREIEEETSITDIKLAKPFIFDVAVNEIPYSQRKNEPEHLHYDVNFIFVVENKDFKVSNESVDIRWVTIDEALKLVDKRDYSMLRMINKYKEIIQKNIMQ